MSDNWKTEHDHRQYELMSLTLRQYEDGTINLPSLVSGLEALLESLEAADREWIDSFRSEWWILEQIYSVAIDRGQTELSAEEEAEINAAITNMRNLMIDRLNAQPDYST
jgi:hypothetical protein